MRSRNYSSEAIILYRTNYGEADRVVVLFTRHFGQIRLLAKGVRKPRSRKRGHLEVFSHIKFSATRSHGMDLLTEIETIDSFPEVRENLKRATVGYFLCEVIGRLTREGDIGEKVFREALTFLHKLKKSDNLRSLRKQFVIRLLVSLGFWSGDKELKDPDKMLEDVTESRVNTIRVAKALLV